MHKRERLAQRASPAIATLITPTIATKRQGFYVELFLDMSLPLGGNWGRSSNRKGVSSLFQSNLFNVIVMPFHIKLSSCKNDFTPLAIKQLLKP